MNRRQFLGNLGALGVSATVAQYLSQDEKEEKVPIIEQYKTIRDEGGAFIGRKPVYGTIDRERHERVEATRDARESVEELLQAQYPSDSKIFIDMTGDDQSPNGFRLEVPVPQGIDQYEVEELLPTEITGGDSGGPLFHIDGSDAAIAGVIKGSWNSSDVLSTTAETIEGRTGGTF
jgi:hypothetical protein